MELNFDPDFKVIDGLTYFIDATSDPRMVIAINAIGMTEPDLWIMDNSLALDLMTLREMFPDRIIALYAWRPDPRVHPNAARAVEALGVVSIAVPPEKVAQLLIDRPWA